MKRKSIEPARTLPIPPDLDDLLHVLRSADLCDPRTEHIAKDLLATFRKLKIPFVDLAAEDDCDCLACLQMSLESAAGNLESVELDFDPDEETSNNMH